MSLGLSVHLAGSSRNRAYKVRRNLNRLLVDLPEGVFYAFPDEVMYVGRIKACKFSVNVVFYGARRASLCPVILFLTLFSILPNICRFCLLRICAYIGKGEVEAHGMDHWVLVGQKLTAEKNLAEDAKKVSPCVRSARGIDLGRGEKHTEESK